MKQPAVPKSLAAAATLGGLSTLGDWIWKRFLTDGALVPALIHGLLFFVALAIVLGWVSRSAGVARRLLTTLPLAGLGLAAAFYPLAGLVGYLPALLLSWFAMWLVLATLLRWARRETVAGRSTLIAGSMAAIGSGLAFWSISDIWTDSTSFTSYPWRFVAWTWAFWPGFASLFHNLSRSPSHETTETDGGQSQ